MSTITSIEQSNGIKITLTVEFCDTSSQNTASHPLLSAAPPENHSFEYGLLLDELRPLIPAQLRESKLLIDSVCLKHAVALQSNTLPDSADQSALDNSLNKNKEDNT